MVNGSAAAQWLLNLGSVDPGYCLRYVWQAYKAQGASTGLSAATAMSGWNQSDGKHPGDRNPPAGAAVWWGRRADGNTDGDVTISLGGGRVAATDYPGWRQTGSCTLDERERQIGREYLGWTSSIFDCPIDVTATGSASWNRTSRSTEDIQRLIGATPDGIFGPETAAKLRAWQSAHGLDADEIFGTLGEAVGFPIQVDGVPGAQTWAKLQDRVGAPVDGVEGPVTWSRIQTALGVPADGVSGPVTYTALQTAVGATPDGVPGPETWSKVQAFLNTGAAFPHIGVASTPSTPSTPSPAPAARTADDPTVPGQWLGKWSANSEPRTGKIQYFVVHHAADTHDPDTQVQRFMSANDRDVSCTWFVGADGVARKIVHPDDRQWTTGRIIDQQAVTVETQNTTGDPSWGISDASHESIAQLVVWASKRYGFPIDRAHVIGHSEARAKLDPTIPATACPGPSMDLDRIVKRAQELTAPVTPAPAPDLTGLAGLIQQLIDLLKKIFGGGK